MIADGYTMDLYCDAMPWGDHPFEYLPHSYYGRTRADCVRQARERGWRFKRDGTVICPLCNRERGVRRGN